MNDDSISSVSPAGVPAGRRLLSALGAAGLVSGAVCTGAQGQSCTLATPDEVTWSTGDFATDPNANALRWATAFSFRFDATAPPLETAHVLGLFKPGAPAEVAFFITDAIFEGDFESGDLAAWSATVGG